MNRNRLHADDLRRNEAARDNWLDQPTPLSLTSPEERVLLTELAKTFPVKRIPYVEPRQQDIVFVKRKLFATKKTREGWDSTGISASDLNTRAVPGSMQIQYRKVCRKRRLQTPDWALNDELLRIVVLRFAEERLYLEDHSGTDQERMD